MAEQLTHHSCTLSSQPLNSLRFRKQLLNSFQFICIEREIDQFIYQQVPYVLLWNINYHRLLYWNKFGTPEWVEPKYGDEYSPIAYWWLDEDSEADLKDAIQTKSPLPPKPAAIQFDEMFEE